MTRMGWQAGDGADCPRALLTGILILLNPLPFPTFSLVKPPCWQALGHGAFGPAVRYVALPGNLSLINLKFPRLSSSGASPEAHKLTSYPLLHPS